MGDLWFRLQEFTVYGFGLQCSGVRGLGSGVLWFRVGSQGFT